MEVLDNRVLRIDEILAEDSFELLLNLAIDHKLASRFIFPLKRTGPVPAE